MNTTEKVISGLLDLPHARMILDQVQAHLNEEEHRRQAFHDNVKEDEKAEFINGEIIMHSPVRVKHWRVNTRISSLLNYYVTKQGLGWVGFEKLLIALSRNSYEPDICFFGKKKIASITDDQKILPAPDFIVEIISETTEHRDRTIKFQDYQNHGVGEYWIVDPDKETVEQYFLEDDEYRLQPKTETIQSRIIHGFSAPVVAFFDDQENIKTVQQMLRE